MGQVTLPKTWVARELLKALDLNADFAAILNQLNGNIDATNLAALAVTAAKLANGAVTGPKIAMGSDAQGDVLFYDGSKYTRLPAGVSGQFLKTQGGAADPLWATVPLDFLKVQSGTVTDQSSFTISGLTAGKKYKLLFQWTQKTAPGFPSLQINGDSGPNYSWSNGYPYTGGTYEAETTAIKPTGGTTNTVYVDSFAAFDLTFIPVSATALKVIGTSSMNYSGNNFEMCYVIGARYLGAAGMTGMSIAVSAGTMTGTWSLYEIS